LSKGLILIVSLFVSYGLPTFRLLNDTAYKKLSRLLFRENWHSTEYRLIDLQGNRFCNLQLAETVHLSNIGNCISLFCESPTLTLLSQNHLCDRDVQ